MSGRGSDTVRAEAIKARAREILRMGLGEPVGDESSRPGIVAAFEAAFPDGDPRRQLIAERLKQPFGGSQNGRGRYFRADIGTPAIPPRRPRATTTIYVVGFAQYVKIGITQRDVQHRIAGIQTGCPEKLEIYATFPGGLLLEKELHRRFAEHRRQGEWFVREGELAEWIAGGCKEVVG
ncbi:GIY-YIG nuclease family protein [Methylobacterium sp. E-005]|uniref:GIY-YIG nuclease family protein n=1 Tax=Methylobacterium sp. E-005 TaxID=2836549 RepID=UPI00391B6AD1